MKGMIDAPAPVDKPPPGLSQCYSFHNLQGHNTALSTPSYCNKHPHPLIYLFSPRYSDKHPYPFIYLTMSIQVSSSNPCKYYKVGH